MWACYCYGGISSPFLPWILIFPLLAFLYLPPVGWVRNVLLIQIFGNVAFFLARCFSGDPLPAVDLEDFQVIGMISMASVALYFAMMSLYFAKMFHEQREFTRELNSLVSTSDNLQNLTAAANQASRAKADFVAGMSHELRTPLNAIIGYSQLLLEEAHDEQDHPTVADLGHVHKAGSNLLRLIDDILSYSRIEAGKMPVHPTLDVVDNHFGAWLSDISEAHAGYQIEVSTAGGRRPCARAGLDCGGLGRPAPDRRGDQPAWQREARPDVVGERRGGLRPDPRRTRPSMASVRPATVANEMFEHGDDTSPTKYGGAGIETALGAEVRASAWRQ